MIPQARALLDRPNEVAWSDGGNLTILTQDRTRDLLARILHGADASEPARIATIEPLRNAPPACA